MPTLTISFEILPDPRIDRSKKYMGHVTIVLLGRVNPDLEKSQSNENAIAAQRYPQIWTKGPGSCIARSLDDMIDSKKESPNDFPDQRSSISTQTRVSQKDTF